MLRSSVTLIIFSNGFNRSNANPFVIRCVRVKLFLNVFRSELYQGQCVLYGGYVSKRYESHFFITFFFFFAYYINFISRNEVEKYYFIIWMGNKIF